MRCDHSAFEREPVTVERVVRVGRRREEAVAVGDRTACPFDEPDGFASFGDAQLRDPFDTPLERTNRPVLRGRGKAAFPGMKDPFQHAARALILQWKFA